MIAVLRACGLFVLSGGLPAVVSRGLSASADSGQATASVARDDGNVAAAAGGAKRTVMQCLGTQTLTRACHFENVYYDLNSTRFVHFGVEGATAEVFGDDLKPDEAWLRLIRCVPPTSKSRIQVHLSK